MSLVANASAFALVRTGKVMAAIAITTITTTSISTRLNADLCKLLHDIRETPTIYGEQLPAGHWGSPPKAQQHFPVSVQFVH